jgi:hypothetical protein
MASPAHHFKAPFLSKETCWAAADQFREQYCPQSEMPVDVLALVEFELDLEIRTITGLKEDADVDALLLGDWKTLILDQQQFLDDRFTNRLRFSIAHELGHFALHKEVFQSIPRKSADEWISFMLTTGCASSWRTSKPEESGSILLQRGKLFSTTSTGCQRITGRRRTVPTGSARLVR